MYVVMPFMRMHETVYEYVYLTEIRSTLVYIGVYKVNITVHIRVLLTRTARCTRNCTVHACTKICGVQFFYGKWFAHKYN